MVHLSVVVCILATAANGEEQPQEAPQEAPQDRRRRNDRYSRNGRGNSNRPSQCEFPFEMNGKVYYDCTTDGSHNGEPWCSTRTDRYGEHVSGQGEYETCGSDDGSEFTHTTHTRHRDGRGGSFSKTTHTSIKNGGNDSHSHKSENQCEFPFEMDGRTYNDCTRDGSEDGKLWCSTRTDRYGEHVSGEGEWAHCGSNYDDSYDNYDDSYDNYDDNYDNYDNYDDNYRGSNYRDHDHYDNDNYRGSYNGRYSADGSASAPEESASADPSPVQAPASDFKASTCAPSVMLALLFLLA